MGRARGRLRDRARAARFVAAAAPEPRARAARGGAARSRAAAVAAALLAAAALGCARGEAPWHVREGDEARFQRASRECRVLTVDAEGREGPIAFDDCMKRRGFRRMGPIRRLFAG